MSGVINTPLAVPLAGRLARRNGAFAAWHRAQTRYARRLLAKTLAHSAFYRAIWDQAGVRPGRAFSLEALTSLPPVDRAAWRAAPDSEIMTTPPGRGLVLHQTGGTSGEPFFMPYLPADDIRLRATVLAVMRMHGVHWHERALWFLPPDTHSRGGQRLWGRVRMVDSDATTEERLRALRSGTEPIVRGYPWPVWRAVVLARRRGIALPPRRLFVTGGEPLPACVRGTLEQGLGARVVNRYSATDFGQMAAECSSGSLHLCVGAHVQIVGEHGPTQPGEEGEVVATNFFSTARPLIRVRTGDHAAWAKTPCPCGLDIPRLAHVSGRTDDAIRTPGGALLRYVELERSLADLAHALLGFQFEQLAHDRVLVRLCLDTGREDTSRTRSRLEASLPGMRILIETTDHLSTEQNGKTRACRGLGAT